MTNRYYLAVDIGASSGRHILFSKENGRIRMSEIYRFENGMKKKDGHRIWDVEHLSREIVAGMKKAGEMGKIPVSVAVDTWGVDYVLLDEDDHILGDVYGYRDKRTEGMDTLLSEKIDSRELYGITGIQEQSYNTIYQLLADQVMRPDLLERARTFLSMPDYFGFYLTGRKANEYTECTTSGLVDAESGNWNRELIRRLGLPQEIFLDLLPAGSVLGQLRPEIAAEVGYDCSFIACASHDTASAVMSMPDPSGKGLYISSGTWSLMGVESEKAVTEEEAHAGGFTNEGGYGGKITLLKNIMGLWMIQSLRHELDDRYSFAELAKLGQEESDFPALVDVNDNRFLAPDSMIGAIQDACRQKGMPVPESPGQLSAVICRSLARCYADTAKKLMDLTGQKFDSINILGGGGQNTFLNRLTVEESGLTVNAGPSEATSVGNAIAQMICAGEFEDLAQARACVRESFAVETFS